MKSESEQSKRREKQPVVSMSMDPIAGMLKSRVLDPPSRPGLLACLDRFEIHELVGYGGMGAVFKARDPNTSEIVAIKLLRKELAVNPRAVHRFLVEARHMQRMSHPNIVQVLEVSDRPEGPYFVMPYMAKGSLAAAIRPGKPCHPSLLLRIAREIASALEHAHARGIIHRDIKPANILFDSSSKAYLTDFGLLRTVYNDSIIDVRRPQCEGTGPYMSPAVAAGQAEDTRCDIYAFGAVLYELLTSVPPYEGQATEEVLRAIQAGPPVPIRDRNPDAPTGLAQIAEWAMARHLRDRYAQMSDVLADLERVERGLAPVGPHGERARPGQSKPPRGSTSDEAERRTNRAPMLVGIAAAVVALTITAVILLTMDRNKRSLPVGGPPTGEPQQREKRLPDPPTTHRNTAPTTHRNDTPPWTTPAHLKGEVLWRLGVPGYTIAIPTGRATHDGREVTQLEHQSARVNSTPLVAKGMVCFHAEGKIFGADPVKGEKKWEFLPFPNSEGVVRNFSISDVASDFNLYDGALLVGAGGRKTGALVSVDLKTGKERWRCDFADSIGRASPVLRGDVAYVVRWGYPTQTVVAFDLKARRTSWKYTWRPGSGGGQPAVANGMVYLVNESKKEKKETKSLVALDAKTGDKKWETPLPPAGGIRGGIAVNDRQVVYLTNAWTIAVDPTRGNILWRYDALGYGNKTAGGPRGEFNGGPTIAGDLVLVGGVLDREGYLLAMNAKTGRGAWRLETIGRPAQIMVSGGAAYFGTTKGFLYAVDASSGNGKWKVSLGGYVFARPAISDGVIYVGNTDGYFFAVRGPNKRGSAP